MRQQLEQQPPPTMEGILPLGGPSGGANVIKLRKQLNEQLLVSHNLYNKKHDLLENKIAQ